jgi:thymidylate kinase
MERDGATLELVRTLCEALEEHGIPYCHWKSNWEVDRSASGDKDLDLLVSPRHAQRFTELLWGLGFREARGRTAHRIPGVLHHYGLDPATGRFVHVHAHHHLVVGDDMTKNYRVPVEDAYIASASPSPLLRVPTAEFEFVLFVIRMVLKHFTVDAMLTGRTALSRSERTEFEHLRERADLARVREGVREHLPMVGETLFDDCARTLGAGATSWSRVSAAHRLQHALAAYARHPQAVDGVVRLWRRQSKRVRRRILGWGTSNTLERGCVIAIVGGDGAGKTSAANDLSAWLAPSFRTLRIHLGRPPRSPLATAVRRSLSLGRRLGLVTGTPLKPSSGVSDADAVPGNAWLLVRVLKARDRYRTYIRARRFAARGGIVISDRYPMAEIRLMDHPRATSLLGTPAVKGMARALVALEQRYFDRIRSPDLLVVLKVDPEVALRRRQHDEPATIRARSGEVWNLEWDHSQACIIDASRSQDEVLADIKSWIWSRL